MINLNDPDFDPPASAKNFDRSPAAVAPNSQSAPNPGRLVASNLTAIPPRLAFLAGLMASFLALGTVGFFILLTVMF